jgi:putative N6-adenine-specific DNA methylase
MTQQQFFAPCPRGLEGVLADELTGLGATTVKEVDGGVGFSGDFALCYRANLHSRIASRILWRVGEAPYRKEEDIYQFAYNLPWADWFDVALSIRVDVNAIKSPLKSLEFITLRIKDAVCDRFRAECGARPDVNTREPDVRIYAFLTADRATLYLDTSGEPLFKRGLRKSHGEAPVRENLAAGILCLSGWEPGTPLLDPMCGAGTFLIEAALMALNIAPGSDRWFAFEKLKNFDAQLWDAVYNEALGAERPKEPLPIYGSDISNVVLEAARENLTAAGLYGVVQLKQADFLDLSAPAPEGVLVANPPYAVRIGEQAELAALYPKLGDVLKQRFTGWRACFFTADLTLAKLIRLQASRRIPLYNGPLECRLFIYDMVAGSRRKPKEPPGVEGTT